MLKVGAMPNILTAVILTKNEEENILRCLAAIPSYINVVVVDSGSTDKTVEIARMNGAAVFENPWPGFAAQRNFALNQCGIDSTWVLFVDADEVYHAQFFIWCMQKLSTDPSIDVFDVPSRLVMCGRVLKYAPGYPILHPRLVRRENVVFTPNFSGHGETTEPCRHDVSVLGYDHHFFADAPTWLNKHLGLAKYEALSVGAAANTRRGQLSRLVSHNLFRPFVRFIYHYIFCRGFLDGQPGLYYSLIYSWYDFTIFLMKKEIKVRENMNR